MHDENDFDAINRILSMTPAKSDYLSQNADIMTSPTPALFNDDFTAAFPQTTMAPALVSDHPVLDDLLSELTRSESRHDLSHFHHSHQSHQRSVPKSEPVDLADMERILLQPPKKSSIRQPFSSRLMSQMHRPPMNNAPFLPDSDSNNPFLQHSDATSDPSAFSDLFSDPTLSCSSLSAVNSNPPPASPLVHLQSCTNFGKIQVKVINNTGAKVAKGTSLSKIKVPAYTSSNRPANQTASYRTYGKKRMPIHAAYADFLCRLQNDIPFDSSEEDEEEDEEYRGLMSMTSIGDEEDENDSDSEAASDSESEDHLTAKIPPQELLELFEDQCEGKAQLVNRKHQISIKRNLLLMAAKRAAASPLMSQSQFETLQQQIQMHFQFLIQNLALANEIEGGEGITLISLKLLVQLHLHLDSTCNLMNSAHATSNNNNPAPASISCLKPAVQKVNPITCRLSDLIPGGIHRVAVIAGFLARPGQKQFLSLAALRSDVTLKPKSTAMPLVLRIKAHAQLNSGTGIQLLSNAFYNIITLFHEYIDTKLLESTVNAESLSKHLELPMQESYVLYGAHNSHPNNCNANTNTTTKTAKFLASEDALLLCGLKRFGCGNWESIQAQFLPCRAARQLAIRYKNLSSRREPMNPVKEFNERMMMPLSEVEEDLLYKGVQKFGNEFHLISQHYLPHRPATILRKLWKALDVSN